jgi:hypothetical protein
MTYSESAKDVTIDLDRAAEELKRHGFGPDSYEFALFFTDVIVKKTYKAKDVLAWLGY